MFFYSKGMGSKLSGAGYYLITLRSNASEHVLRSNNERAFVMSQLQDLLGRRSLLEDPEIRHRLPSHIDLLAFSILDQDIKLVVFSIARGSADSFAHSIATRLYNYQSEWLLAPSFRKAKPSAPTARVRRLAGPYDALNQSVKLHMRHNDWEYDRYSSIGFYLHDRRGDWMHVWRMSNLYENNSSRYYELATTPQFAPLSHA